MAGWFYCTAALLLIACTIQEGDAQAIPCFTGTGCMDSDDAGILDTVFTCCSMSNTFTYRPSVGSEQCLPCYTYGWAENIASDKSSSDPITPFITAVEGDTVTLTLFFFKNSPLNTQSFIHNLMLGGTATEGTDYIITDNDGVDNFVVLQEDPVQVNVTLLNDGVGGEGEEDIILTLEVNEQFTPIDDFAILSNSTVTITVGDNDIQTGFELDNKVTVDEGTVTMLCLATTGMPATYTTITVGVTYGTADRADITLVTPELNITRTNNKPCVSLEALNDNLGLEGVENLTLTLNGPPNVEFTNNTIEVCIQDINDIEFGFLASMPDTAEADGHEENQAINVTITRSGATAVDVAFTFTPIEYNSSFGFSIPSFDPDSPNIARPGQDFPEDVISFVIPAGDGPTVIQVPIIDDDVAEDSEQQFMGVLDFDGDDDVPGARLGINHILLGIFDDDDATLAFYSSIEEVLEQNVDFTYFLNITRDIDSELNYALTLSATPLTAEPDDFSVNPGPYRFPPNVSSILVPVTIAGDTTIELTDTFDVSLRPSSGPGFLPSLVPVRVAILNDDGNYMYVPQEESSMINEGTQSQVTFILLNPPSDGIFDFEFDVSLSTVDGTATGGTDYVEKDGEVIQASQLPNGTFSTRVFVFDDTRVELHEYFSVVGMVPRSSDGVELPVEFSSDLTVFITNNDLAMISLEELTATVIEGRPALICTEEIVIDNLDANFTLSLTASGGTATEDVDFLADDVMVTIGAMGVVGSGTMGSGMQPLAPITACINVDTLVDTLVEGDETLTVSVEATTNAELVEIIGGNTATVTITDITVELSVQRLQYTVSEGGVVQVCVGASSGSVVEPVTVSFSTRPISATEGADYTLETSVVVLTATNPTACADVSTRTDNLVEGDETFVIMIASDTEYAVLRSANATVTILGELAMIGFESGMHMAVEPGMVEVCVTVRNGFLANSLAVPINVLPTSTATEGMDFEFPTGSVINIGVGMNRSCIGVTILESMVIEEEEEIILAIDSSIMADIVGPQTTIVIAADGVVVIGFGDAGYTIQEGEPVDIVVAKLSAFDSDIQFEVSMNGMLVGADVFPAGGNPNRTEIAIPFTAPDDSIALQDDVRLLAVLRVLTSSPQIMVVNMIIPIIIQDNEGVVTVGFNNPAIVVTEDVETFLVSVSIDQEIANPLTVDVVFSIGEALPGIDYVPRPIFRLVFTSNDTETFEVSIINDNMVEPTESFNISLLFPLPSRAVIGAGTFTVVIQDDDTPMVRFDRPFYPTSELANNVSVCVIVTNGRLPAELVVDVDVLPSSTAELGTDYVFAVGPQITIPAGEFMSCLSISIIPSMVVEGAEVINLAINETTTAAVVEAGLGETTIQIATDGVVTVGFTQPTYTFSEGRLATVVIEKSGSLDMAIVLTVSDGVRTFTETFPAGDSTPNTLALTQMIPDNDVALEPPRFMQYNLTLVSPVNLVMLGQATTIITILDDEGAVFLQLDEADISVRESEGRVFVPVSISSLVAVPVRASISFEFFTADQDDIVRTGQSDVVFSPRRPTNQTILVGIRDDLISEPDEVFAVVLTNPMPGAGSVVISNNITFITIINDDVLVVFGFQDRDFSVSEDSGTVNIPITIPVVVAPITFSVEFTDFSAVQGTDYRVIGPTTLTFNTNGTQFIAVEILDNFIDNPNKVFTISIRNETSAGSVAVFPRTLSVIIVDDDNIITVGFGNVAFTVEEDSGINILPVVVSEPVPTAISFTVVFTDGTATVGEDYASSVGPATVTIPPFSTRGEVLVGILDDFTDESTETFSIALTNLVADASVIVNPNTTVVSILDDDETLVIGFGATRFSVLESTPVLEIPLTVRQPLPVPVTVSVVFTDGTATQGVDYIVPGVSTITFTDNVTRTIRVRIINDVVDEPTESFSIMLTNPVSDASVSLDPNTATVDIIDDDDVTTQPPTVDVVNDTVVGDPFYTVPIVTDGGVPGLDATKDVSLCYELHGDPGLTFNLVNDVCTLVNARYTSALAGGSDVNVMDRVSIRAKDDADNYRNISVSLAGCSVSIDGVDIPSRYDMNNVSITRYTNSAQGPRVRVSVPNCNSGNALVMWMICENRALPGTGEITVGMIKFVIARGRGISTSAHGLLGQMWNARFTVTDYTGDMGFLDPEVRHYYVAVTNGRPTRTFIASLQPRSWDKTRGYCLYGGNRQSGPTGDIPEDEVPNGSVIEGEYFQYVVSDEFASDCNFCTRFGSGVYGR